MGEIPFNPPFDKLRAGSFSKGETRAGISLCKRENERDFGNDIRPDSRR